MNALSLLSAMLATACFIGAFYCLTRGRKSILNVFSFLVLLCLGWWNFCSVFFFSAQTTDEAWRWHKLAAFGWTGFIAETTYYFIVLTGLHKRMKKLWIQLAFYALPALLLAYNLFSSKTSLAEKLVRSRIGGQWTYVNTIGNVWLWIYLACLVLYFGFSFTLLLRWSSSVKHRLKKRMAMSFVVLDALTILLGFVTDVLSPLTTQLLPAAANLCTALFGAGYFFIINWFDLFNVHLVVADRDIIEHSMDSILVTDEVGEILYCNPACTELLGLDKPKLIGASLPRLLEERQYAAKIQDALGHSDSVINAELLYSAPDEQKNLLMAASVIRDRQREYMGTVVSLRDITQLSRLKEQYRIQSEKYQKLAYVDALTGLPNRRKTFEVLAQRAVRYAQSQTDFFVLYMDIDEFKSVNDLYGHRVGDLLLISVAKRMSDCVYGDIDFLGRMSGDELLMIGGPSTNEDVILACAARLTEAFGKTFEIEGRRFRSGISVGWARYSDFLDIDAMMHHADTQMYGAKQISHAKTRADARTPERTASLSAPPHGMANHRS